ncbi:MAG: thioredoxin family protein [Dehalococcoidia bacterium]
MGKLKALSDHNFDRVVGKAKRPLVVEFCAPSSESCLAIAPIVEELANEYQGKVDFVTINVDKNHKAASAYGIMNIPALLVFEDGALTKQIVGLRPKKQLKRLLNISLHSAAEAGSP